jgi:MFS family permease
VTDTALARRSRRIAAALFVGLAVVYNANGREIGTVDSQPAKFTARELAMAGTLTLDRVVAERPGLGERPAFARDRLGHFRSAYPLPSALVATIPAAILHYSGLVDLRAPLAPNLVAALTASLLTAGAVTLLFLAVGRLVPDRVAVITAMAIGLGTNYWAVVSQTLWQHESVAFGLALVVWAWLRPVPEIRTRELILGGLGLALAGAARPQVSPLVAILLVWLATRAGWRRTLVPGVIVGIAAGVTIATNYAWFGHVLGAAPRLESIHPETHGVPGTISRTPWVGALGLLISPSRGLLVFSPFVLVALAARRAPAELGLRWLTAGVAVQFAVYASYTVWWGGHTYGPRYTMDLIAPMAPMIALGFVRALTLVWTRIGVVILVLWSMLVAGAGAFIYPNDAWNTSPAEVDRFHHRLWEVRDSQIPRVFRSGWSPQNFGYGDGLVFHGSVEH